MVTLFANFSRAIWHSSKEAFHFLLIFCQLTKNLKLTLETCVNYGSVDCGTVCVRICVYRYKAYFNKPSWELPSLAVCFQASHNISKTTSLAAYCRKWVPNKYSLFSSKQRNNLFVAIMVYVVTLVMELRMVEQAVLVCCITSLVSFLKKPIHEVMLQNIWK